MSIIMMTEQLSQEPPQELESLAQEQQKPASESAPETPQLPTQDPKQDQPCVGCKSLQLELANTVSLMLTRMDQMQTKIEELLTEREIKNIEESPGSSRKITPSSTRSRNSPKLDVPSASSPVASASTSAPTIAAVSAPPAANGVASRKRKTKVRSPTLTTAASPLPDFSNFVNGFMFDPMNTAMNMNNQVGMMQLLSFVQQQQQQAAPQSQQSQQPVSPPEAKQAKIEEPAAKITPKEEPTELSPETSTDSEMMTSESMVSHAQHLLDAISAQFNNGQAATSNTPSSSSPATPLVAQVKVEATATPSRSENDDSNDTNTARCSNCNTDKTTAWRRDADGKLVCNPCGLYYRLHKVRRPIEMRKNHIQQRYRRKNKDVKVELPGFGDVKLEPGFNDQAFLNQLLTSIPKTTQQQPADAKWEAPAANSLSFLEQITQFTQAQEPMNSSAFF